MGTEVETGEVSALALQRKCAVTPQSHGGLYWQSPTSYLHATQRGLVPLSLAEVLPAAAWLPIVFVRAGSAPAPAALIGKTDNEGSPFVSPKGQFRAGFVPLMIRAHPFSIAEFEGQAVLVTDPTSGHITSESTGHAFYQADGTLSAETARVSQALSIWAKDRILAIRATQALDEAGLIEWDAKSGFGTIRLTELRAGDLGEAAKLQELRAFEVAYGQSISQAHAIKLDAKSRPAIPKPLSSNDEAEALLDLFSGALIDDDALQDLL